MFHRVPPSFDSGQPPKVGQPPKAGQRNFAYPRRPDFGPLATRLTLAYPWRLPRVERRWNTVEHGGTRRNTGRNGSGKCLGVSGSALGRLFRRVPPCSTRLAALSYFFPQNLHCPGYRVSSLCRSSHAKVQKKRAPAAGIHYTYKPKCVLLTPQRPK